MSVRYWKNYIEETTHIKNHLTELGKLNSLSLTYANDKKRLIKKFGKNEHILLMADLYDDSKILFN